MSEALTSKARDLFRDHFGHDCNGVSFAPGRVNLIGEHVDYNDGLVLPMPVKEGTAVAWSLHEEDQTEVWAADLDEGDCFPSSHAQEPGEVGWRSYVRGMAAQWEAKLPGLRLLITGDLPRGSGLSSSASLCIALGRAFAGATGDPVDATTIARRAQQTEHEFAGVACGIMDQMAVAAGKHGHAMLLDCRDLSYQHFKLPGDWAVITVDSGIRRDLSRSSFNSRRRQCDTAAAAIGVSSLRDASLKELEDAKIDDAAARRARHVIEEIERVRNATEAILARDLTALGDILRASHCSLRDLFEVSVPPVDAIVDELNEAIGLEGGARMTGAGFGGSIVAILPKDGLKSALANIRHFSHQMLP